MTSQPQASPSPSSGSGKEQRLVKLQRLLEKGCKPFGQAFPVTVRLCELRAAFDETARAFKPPYGEGTPVRIAGRLVTVRDMGKSIFAHVADGNDRFQVYAGKSHTEDFEGFKQLLDAGDYIGVDGDLFVTRMGEPTVRITKWTVLSKALQPLPEKWHGLKDVEMRYRQRYLDLISNPGVRTVFDLRCRIVRAIRTFLWDEGFTEVETPMMQPQAGGANARPFITHFEALSSDMYLRIAPELYLKRLLVGGYTKVFELNRNFRNEGLSKSHNPEFTMLEIYQAFTDVRGIKSLVERMITTVAQSVIGSLQVGEGDQRIDLSLPWREVTYRDIIKDTMGADWFELPVDQARARAEARGVSCDPAWPLPLVSHEVYEKLIEKQLKNPTFVTRLPKELVPLAKACDDDPTVVDVFELVINGREVAPGYSEQNDPLEQRRSFEAQAGDEAQRVDEDFLLALEHGMPPAGGTGIGIDRLVMTLTGAETIRDVILFPQLRPKKETEMAGDQAPVDEPLAGGSIPAGA